MKQDITDRLNGLGDTLLDPAEFSIIRDAVAEIERLRARQAELASPQGAALKAEEAGDAL